MHLADGIVTNTGVLVGLDLVGAGAVTVAARHADAEDGRAVAWTGMLAAFLLAAQAVNVPLLPGTSAHVVGAALVTLAVGPARAIVAMTAVLLIQALAFGDGGITVLGINVLNLAVLPSLAMELVATIVGRTGRALPISAVLGTLVGNLAGAGALAAVLVAGAGAAGRIAFPWLVGAHALSGLAEGLLTAVAVAQLERRAPGLVSRRGDGATAGGPGPRSLRTALAWTAICVGLATALVPLRSTAPDALERLLPALGAHP